jgi:hypothetical protein
MGCGWKRWRNEAGIERLRIFQMAWQETDSVFAKVMRGAVWQLQQESAASDRRTSCWNHRLLGMKLQLWRICIHGWDDCGSG